METEKFNEIKELFATRDRLAQIKAFTEEHAAETWIFKGIVTDGDDGISGMEVAMPETLKTAFASIVSAALTEAEEAVSEA